MPENLITLPENDFPELDELRLLAPESLDAAAPKWSIARDDIRDRIVAEPVIPQHRTRWARLAVAAVAMLTVGGLGYGALTANNQTVSPAAPPSASTSVQFQTVRTIPAGQYLVESTDSTDRRDQGAITGAPNGKITTKKDVRQTVVDSDLNGTITWKLPAPGSTTFKAELGYDKAPSDPAQLRSWLLGLAGDRNDRSDADIVFTGATDALRDRMTSTQFRQALVAVLRTNPGTTTEQVTVGGKPAVRVSFGQDYPADRAWLPSHEVRTMTLDGATMALLAESDIVKTLDGRLVRDYQTTVTEPLHLTRTRP